METLRAHCFADSVMPSWCMWEPRFRRHFLKPRRAQTKQKRNEKFPTRDRSPPQRRLLCRPPMGSQVQFQYSYSTVPVQLQYSNVVYCDAPRSARCFGSEDCATSVAGNSTLRPRRKAARVAAIMVGGHGGAPPPVPSSAVAGRCCMGGEVVEQDSPVDDDLPPLLSLGPFGSAADGGIATPAVGDGIAGAAASRARASSGHVAPSPAPLVRGPADAVPGVGPPILVVLVGCAGGRWAELGSADLEASLGLAAAFQSCEDSAAGHVAYGFAVLRSWSLAQLRPCTPSLSVLLSHLASRHLRCGPCAFLQHEVIRSCAFVEPLPLDLGLAPAASNAAIATHLEVAMQDRPVTLPCSTVRCCLAEVLRLWRRDMDGLHTVYAWPCCPAFAVGIAVGHVGHDLTILLRRNSGGAWMPPVLPSRRVRQQLVRNGQAPRVVLAAATSATGGGATNRRFRGHAAFGAEALIASVRAGRGLLSQTMAPANARDVLDNPLSGLARVGLDSGSFGQRHPGGALLRRSRIRIDIAAMLWNREVYVHTGPMYRYIACDASPQVSQSFEVFVTVERVIRRHDVAGQSFDTVPAGSLSTRVLPLVTLGHGRCALEDKVAAHLHQTFLDYGPSVGHVVAACADVRQVMSDMGTEFGIANFPNVVGHVLGQARRWSGQAVPWSGIPGSLETPYLYPFALQVPGLLHIVDWLIRDTVQQLPWWAEWQSHCKRVLQFCHGQARRERMQAILRDQAPGAQQEKWVSSLSCATGRFADWRWKTLAGAVADLAKVEEALRFLALECGDWAQVLGSRDSQSISSLQSTCASALFWDRSRCVAMLIAPLMTFMGWLQGCDCHEQQLLQGQVVVCPLKGCRARSLAKRLVSLQSELSRCRSSVRPGCLGMVSVLDFSLAVTHCMASAELKFMWVTELPYLVWQAWAVSSGVGGGKAAPFPLGGGREAGACYFSGGPLCRCRRHRPSVRPIGCLGPLCCVFRMSGEGRLREDMSVAHGGPPNAAGGRPECRQGHAGQVCGFVVARPPSSASCGALLDGCGPRTVGARFRSVGACWCDVGKTTVRTDCVPVVHVGRHQRRAAACPGRSRGQGEHPTIALMVVCHSALGPEPQGACSEPARSAGQVRGLVLSLEVARPGQAVFVHGPLPAQGAHAPIHAHGLPHGGWPVAGVLGPVEGGGELDQGRACGSEALGHRGLGQGVYLMLLRPGFCG